MKAQNEGLFTFSHPYANNRLGNIAENVSGTETNGGLFRFLSYEHIFIKQN